MFGSLFNFVSSISQSLEALLVWQAFVLCNYIPLSCNKMSDYTGLGFEPVTAFVDPLPKSGKGSGVEGFV